MAGDWVKIRTSLWRDGRIKVASRKCRVNDATILGAFVALLSLADENADEDGTLIGYKPEDIDRLVDIEGFCSALDKSWINLDGEYVQLPNYQLHNGQSAKQRSKLTIRKREERTRQKRDKNATKHATREEKRREEILTPLPPENSLGHQPEIDPDLVKRTFEAFMEAYPKWEQWHRDAAFHAWCRFRCGYVADEVMAGLEIDKKSEAWHEEGGKYIPGVIKYIEEGRWRKGGRSIAALPAAVDEKNSEKLREIRARAAAMDEVTT